MLDVRLQHAHQAAHDAEMAASAQALAPALVSLAVSLRLVIEFLGTRDLPEQPPEPRPFTTLPGGAQLGDVIDARD